ncbi:MAG: alpha/beta hydrolase [Gemmatimonadota bacterium]|nr:alpha/beta hydrolase [Gemmatimonadota bacterium]
MSDRSGFLEADGKRLEYRWFGGGPSPRAVVLLHHGLGCVGTWRDFPDRLAALTGRPVFAYSRVGYGASDPVDLPRPWTYMHHEGEVVLPQVLEAAGIEEAVLVGHSDGGSIAIVYAGLQGRGEGPPTTGARVTGLVLIAAHVFNEPVSRATIEDVGHRFRETDLRKKLAKHHGNNVECAFWGWHDVWISPDFESWNLEEFMPSITLPVMLLQGSDDNFGTLRQVDVIVRGIAGPVERVMIPDCGHSPHREQPEVLLETIGRFLA